MPLWPDRTFKAHDPSFDPPRLGRGTMPLSQSIVSLKMIFHLFHLKQRLLNDPLCLSDQLLIPVWFIGVAVWITGLAAVEKIVSHYAYGHE